MCKFIWIVTSIDDCNTKTSMQMKLDVSEYSIIKKQMTIIPTIHSTDNTITLPGYSIFLGRKEEENENTTKPYLVHSIKLIKSCQYREN